MQIELNYREICALTFSATFALVARDYDSQFEKSEARAEAGDRLMGGLELLEDPLLRKTLAQLTKRLGELSNTAEIDLGDLVRAKEEIIADLDARARRAAARSRSTHRHGKP